MRMETGVPQEEHCSKLNSFKPSYKYLENNSDLSWRVLALHLRAPYARMRSDGIVARVRE